MKVQSVPKGDSYHRLLRFPTYIRQRLRACHELVTWAALYRDHATLALYNTPSGRLFIDPWCKEAHTYYDYRWKWVRFADHWLPHQIMVVNDHFPPYMTEYTLFQHVGHNEMKTAWIKVSNRWNPQLRAFEADLTFHIPVFNILYVAIKGGQVRGNLLVYQPLPHFLMISDPNWRL